jgi:hypothetical protein
MKKFKELREHSLEESGGPVVYKQGNNHIEKYGDDSFAVYKDGKKTKHYKTMDAAKSALDESVEEGVMAAVKNLAAKAGKALTGGSDEDQRKDLQRKMGVQQTGKKPMQK